MVIEIANKSSSGSTCVLVRRVTRDPFPGRDGVCDPEPFTSFSLCSRSWCSPSVFSWYLLCTPLMQGEVCPWSMLVRGLRTPSGMGCGRGLLVCGLLTSHCLFSVAPQASCPPQRGPPSAKAVCPTVRATHGQHTPVVGWLRTYVLGLQQLFLCTVPRASGRAAPALATW